MGTGYAIVSTERGAAGQPRTKVWQILWREEEAAEQVRRLNALGPAGVESYSWQTTWVARPDRNVHPALTPDDRDKLERAHTLGAIRTARPLSVSFSFPFDVEGARAACGELENRGWPDARYLQEVTGDDLWHAVGLGLRMVLAGNDPRPSRRYGGHRRTPSRHVRRLGRLR